MVTMILIIFIQLINLTNDFNHMLNSQHNFSTSADPTTFLMGDDYNYVTFRIDQ